MAGQSSGDVRVDKEAIPALLGLHKYTILSSLTFTIHFVADPSLQVHIPLYALAKQKIRGDVFVPANDVVEPLMFKAYKAIP